MWPPFFQFFAEADKYKQEAQMVMGKHNVLIIYPDKLGVLYIK
jgi:hypothetical protein